MSEFDLSKLKKNTKPTTSFLKQLEAVLNKDISFSSGKLSDKQKEVFYLELSTLLGAGVDIKTALELISAEQEKEKDRTFFADIQQRIIQGAALSDALQQTGDFSPYEYHSIRIGEESGKMPPVLVELATYYRQKIKQRRQIISALTYPAIVLCTAIGAIVFMMQFIVPMFADVFRRSGGDLPALTAVILQLSKWIGSYGWIFLLLLIAAIAAAYNQRKELYFRKFTSQLLLRLPVFGPIVHRIYLARLCQSLTLLIGARVPILRAIGLVRQMIGFYPIEHSLEIVEQQVLKGVPLYESLQAFPIYPPKLVLLIRVGEEVNRLDFFFDQIAKQYTEEVEYKTSIIGSLVEPFLIIFLGLFVGIILIAMYLPLFKLGTAF